MTGTVRAPSGALAVEMIRSWAEERCLVFHGGGLSGSGAVFSQCGDYRYLLWRSWHTEPFVAFGMLNPSTADHELDDPTIKRCRSWAAKAKGGLLVWNLFALRSTDPQALYGHANPVGPDNDGAIDLALSLSGMTVAAWGNHGALAERDRTVKRRCGAAGAGLHALKVTGSGQPGHPLYLAAKLDPVPWEYEW